MDVNKALLCPKELRICYILWEMFKIFDLVPYHCFLGFFFSSSSSPQDQKRISSGPSLRSIVLVSLGNSLNNIAN